FFLMIAGFRHSRKRKGDDCSTPAVTEANYVCHRPTRTAFAVRANCKAADRSRRVLAMSTLCFNNSRDVELLSSLVMGPLTTAQLQKLSSIFAEGPFQSPRTLLDRLHRLAAGGFVRRFPLAIVSARGGGLPYYYKLTPAGLRLLYGDNIQAPSKKFFAPIAIARHHHTHSLSDF